MLSATEYLTNMQCTVKLHESMLKSVCETYELTLMEGNVISFLHNNPGKDTAADIVELRMLCKSNVSQAVESLICKKLLVRTPDTKDRRRIHLSLTPEAEPIIRDIEQIHRGFRQAVFKDFSAEDLECFDRLCRRMTENTKNAMKGRN